MTNPLLDPLTPGHPPLLEPMAWLGGLGVFGAAYALGRWIVPRRPGWRAGDLALLRLTAGLPLTAVAMLALGHFGFLTLGRFLFALLALTGGGLLVWDWLRREPHRAAPAPLGQGRAGRLTGTVGWLVVTGWLAVMLGPAFSPSASYDVLEYHMAFVTEALRTGRLAPIPGVFYTHQPLATETLDVLAALLEGTAWGHAPGLAHWLAVVLATLIFARLGRALRWPAEWTPWVWLLVLASAPVLPAQLDRFSDFTGVLMLLGGLWLAAQPGARRGGAWLGLLMGVLAGGAIGAKWTCAATVALPLGLVALGTARPGGRWRRLGGFVLGGAGTMLGWHLWLGAGGNPIAPFGARWFPTPAWDAARQQFLMATHDPLSPAGWAYWANLAGRVGHLPLLAAGGALGVAGLWRGRGVRRRLPLAGLLLGLAGGLLLWGQLRHAAVRFLAPSMALAAVVAMLGLARWGGGARWRAGAGGGLALVALLTVMPVLGEVGRARFHAVALGWIAPREHLDGALGGINTAMFEQVERLGAEHRVLAIHEARGAYWSTPVALSTVFDRQPIRPFLDAAADAGDLRRRLTEAGFTHLLVNEFEQLRLLRMHTPPALLGDAAFQALLAQPPSAAGDAALTVRYWGYAEFAAAPLPAGRRAVYLAFLDAMRARAVWRAGEGPAIWLAPLAP